MKFEDCTPALCAEVLAGIHELGFTDMTPVQSATIPLFLTNKDVAVDASTGSGKTLSFVIPIVEMIRRRNIATQDDNAASILSTKKYTQLMSMVLSPTRELARQIYDQALFFFSRVLPNVHVLLFVGGTSVDEDILAIRAAKGQMSVIVGTPGRIEDVMNRVSTMQIIETKEFEVLILDEADTLLDMGFEISITNILSHIPKQRRTGLFSATQTQEVKALAKAGLRNPATVSVQLATDTKTPSTLTNYYAAVEYDSKLAALVEFISERPESKHIVFFSTCASVDFFGAVLKLILQKKEIPVVTLHGKMQPKKRISHYDEFVGLENGLLVCTDVVARGIDLPDVDWIIQFDPPQDPNFFVHRVGRTARAGRSGCALTFLSSNEDAYVNFLKIRKVPLNEMKLNILNETKNNILNQVKEFQLNDRDILEKGTKAFISFIRSYKEHQCQFIFRFKDLNLTNVAIGFSLFQLPKINEFRNLNDIKFIESGIKIVDIPYKDKIREKQRQKKLNEIKIEHQNEKLKRYEKKENEKKRKLIDDKTPRRRDKKKGIQQQIIEEWNELEKEEHLYKKLKRGKITKEEYEEAIDETMDENGLTKNEQKFIKKEPIKKQKTTQQKQDAAKREERIRARKKSTHIQKKQQRMKGQSRR